MICVTFLGGNRRYDAVAAHRCCNNRPRQSGENMPEGSPAQDTLKRLIEAEEQARQILKAAEERGRETIAQAQEQAKQSVETIRQETAALLQSRLEEAESKAATETTQRLGRAEAEAREIERREKQHFADAVGIVVDWVAAGGN